MQLSTEQRIATLLFSLFVVVVLSSISVHASDESGYTISASVDEVRLAFAVSDRQGRVIKSLRSTDVAVADNGTIIRHFRSFRPASEVPLELVILLDASDSVASQIPDEIAEVKSFIENSTWGKQDRVSILAFGGQRLIVLCAGNCRARIAQGNLSLLHASGATPLYDALFQSAEILKKNRDPESRPAIILFSDGVDTISRHSSGEALQAAQNLESAIYSVAPRSRKSGPSQGDAVLDHFAGCTGGLSFRPGQNTTEILRMVLQDLHSGYVLTYELPERSTGQHLVRILPTSDPRLQFRSRLAYDVAGNE